MGRRFGWLWGAYGTSALGTWLAFGAFPLIAIQVLHAGPAEVAALSCVGAVVGAAVAVPLGPWDPTAVPPPPGRPSPRTGADTQPHLTGRHSRHRDRATAPSERLASPRTTRR
ncbi:hypothetical protein GCM10020216_105820 [Nonomuraea helvata]